MSATCSDATDDSMSYGESNAALKPLSEVHLPDPTWKCFDTGPVTGLEMLHTHLERAELHGAVPHEIRAYFEAARNLLLYSWFVFEFHAAAELQAYASLELTLRTRLPDAKREMRRGAHVMLLPQSLGPLLRLAFEQRLLVAQELPSWDSMMKRRKLEEQELSHDSDWVSLSPEEWLVAVLESIPRSRNRLAHGAPQQDLVGAISNLLLCADLINALFRSPASPGGT